MKFIADESVEGPVVTALRGLGHEVEYVAEWNPGMSDNDILDRANMEGVVLITLDKDFGDLVYHQRKITNGIVLLRLEGLSTKEKIQQVTSSITTAGEKLKKSFTVVSSGQVRIRKFE